MHKTCSQYMRPYFANLHVLICSIKYEVHPIYYDPVHDFGFLKFDPAEIKYMQITKLKLQSESTHVDIEIQVLDNNAGEKLSILSGIISRLDWNAPEYGKEYNNFNINYIQAAAAATGGSSGSPVININGHTITLIAGGCIDYVMTDFFLPLNHPLQALECIYKAESVTHDIIQIQW